MRKAKLIGRIFKINGTYYRIKGGFADVVYAVELKGITNLRAKMNARCITFGLTEVVTNLCDSNISKRPKRYASLVTY